MQHDDSREYLLNLLATEKETLASYERLCAYYKIDPHPIAMATASAKIEILTLLIRGKLVVKI